MTPLSPSDHYVRIYASRADDYHRMVQAEDVDGNLLDALLTIAHPQGARLLDLGSGTGRIPILLHPYTSSVTALDLHPAMLRCQADQRDALGRSWPLLQGDMRRLPFPSRSFDIVTAGWALGHFPSWYPHDGYAQMSKVLHEMRRVVVPSGRLVIIETLTTGSLTPAPPTESLAAYYAWLENEHGFTRTPIQTDYLFASPEEAAAATEFFFGHELAEKILANHWARLPEWTGVWSKTI